MLTEEQYQALCRYRDTTVPASGKPDDLTSYFLERNFIRIERTEYSVKSECEVFYSKKSWVLTKQGKLALEEFEEHRAKTWESRIWQIISVTIGLLTLAVTILFGILTLLH